jgi:hypothetical protein
MMSGKGEQKLSERLKQRLYSERLGEGKRIVLRESSGEKMSKVLLQLIEPYRRLAQGRENLEKLLTISMIAWNASLMPEGERESFLTKRIDLALSHRSDNLVKDFRTMVDGFIKRKELLFPENKRFIVDYELLERGNKYYLSVISKSQRD